MLTQASEVGDAVWVLLNAASGDPTILYLLDKGSGAVVARLAVSLPSSALKFAVDRTAGRVYLTVPDEAAVYSADVSEVPDDWR